MTKKKLILVIISIILITLIITPFTNSKYTTSYNNTIVINVRQPNYTVVFNKNDNLATGTMNNQSFTYGTSQALTTNSFLKTDYHFSTWNTEPNGTGTTYEDEEVVNKLTSIENGTVNLYAQWKENIVVTFDPDGGTIPSGAAWDGSGSTASKHINSATYGTLPTPTKSGYTFLGWEISKLPAEYQEVEYIESTGTQYIDTGILPTNTKGFYAKVSSSDISSDSVYFGSRYNDGSRFWVANDSNKIYYGWNTNTYRNTYISVNTAYEVSLNYLNDRKEMFNDELIADIGETLGTNNNSIYLFAGNDVIAKWYSKIKLYEFKISDGNNVIRDYIPCYRKSDGEIGLYDIIGETFYTNDGTGTFNKGNNVNDTLITSTTMVTLEENHKLLAIWGHNPTVTFNADGGTVNPGTKTYNYNSYYVDMPTPTKSGYAFFGWTVSKLPVEYQEVEYIKFNGAERIDTGIIPSNHTIEIDFDFELFANNETLFGTSRGYNYYSFKSANTNKYTWGRNGSRANSENNSWTTGKHKLIYNNGNNYSVLIDGTSLGSGTNITSNNSLILGAMNTSDYLNGKIYYVKITDKDTGNVVKELIPCYRTSDGVIGFYDLISETFYTNVGTGTFSKGNDTNKHVKIITSSDQMITNENHTLTAKWGKYINVSFDTRGGNTIADKQYLVDDNYDDLPIPERPGYIFKGWVNEYLTDEYIKLESITSDGSQYINTGIQAGNTKGMYARVSSSDISTDAIYFGSRAATNTRFWVGNNGRKIYFGWNNNTYRSTEIVADTVNTVKLNYLNDRKSMFNDEVIKDIGSETLGSSKDIFIFAGNNNGSANYYAKITLYEFKISDNNTVIADFVPCYRLSDGVIGLYNTYDDTFHSNLKTGSSVTQFCKGATSFVNENTIVTNDQNHTLYALWEETLGAVVSGNPSNWTNQDVTLTVTPNRPAEVSKYSFDGGTTWQDSNTKTYTTNTSNINVKIKDINNEVIDVDVINITKIDKVSPTITADNRIIVTLDESNVLNTIYSSSDADSGINASTFKIYRNVVALGVCTDEITNTTYFTYPGLYAVDISVSDNAGNTTIQSAEILVRWPTGGKYIFKKTDLDGAGIVGTGMATGGTTSGLYEDTAATGYDATMDFASKYYYSGPSVDNIITFGGYDYKIINIAVNDDIKVIAPISSRDIYWGNKKIYSSSIYTQWQSWWSGKYLYTASSGVLTPADSNYRTFTDTNLSHIDEAEFYVGRFSEDETPTLAKTIEFERTGNRNLGDSGTEAASFSGHFAFPNVSDYIKACNSQDVVYNITSSQSNGSTFINCSWLSVTTGDDQWTMNSKKATSALSAEDDFWKLDGDTNILGNSTNIIKDTSITIAENYRPVFYLKEDTIISGSGTSGDKYIVQEDWNWFDNNQVLQ